MATQEQATTNLATIRDDASRVIKDITKLSTQLRHAGVEGAEEVGALASRSLKDELKQLTGPNAGFKKVAVKYRDAVHGSVKSKPYGFICGALSFGYVLGMLLPSPLARRK